MLPPELWSRSPFPNLAVGEDTEFIWRAAERAAVALVGSDFYVGLVHPGNTSVKLTAGPQWHSHPVDEAHSRLGSDLAFYRSH